MWAPASPLFGLALLLLLCCSCRSVSVAAAATSTTTSTVVVTAGDNVTLSCEEEGAGASNPSGLIFFWKKKNVYANQRQGCQVLGS